MMRFGGGKKIYGLILLSYQIGPPNPSPPHEFFLQIPTTLMGRLGFCFSSEFIHHNKNNQNCICTQTTKPPLPQRSRPFYYYTFAILSSSSSSEFEFDFDPLSFLKNSGVQLTDCCSSLGGIPSCWQLRQEDHLHSTKLQILQRGMKKEESVVVASIRSSQ